MAFCCIPVLLTLLASPRLEIAQRISVLDIASCAVHKSDKEYDALKPMQITSYADTGTSFGNLAVWKEGHAWYHVDIFISPIPDHSLPTLPGFRTYIPDLDPHFPSAYTTALTLPTKVMIDGRAGSQHEDLFVGSGSDFPSVTVSIPNGKGHMTITGTAFATGQYTMPLLVLEREVNAILASWKWTASH